MALSLRIDAYALCASPFAAPAVLALVGLILGYSPHAGILAILFYQCIYAAGLAPIFFVITLPVCWLIARFAPLPNHRTRLLASLIALSALAVAVASNSRYLIPSHNPVITDSVVVLMGVGLNALTFLWLNYSPNLTFKRDALKRAP